MITVDQALELACAQQWPGYQSYLAESPSTALSLKEWLRQGLYAAYNAYTNDRDSKFNRRYKYVEDYALMYLGLDKTYSLTANGVVYHFLNPLENEVAAEIATLIPKGAGAQTVRAYVNYLRDWVWSEPPASFKDWFLLYIDVDFDRDSNEGETEAEFCHRMYADPQALWRERFIDNGRWISEA